MQEPERSPLDTLIGRSAAMAAVRREAARVAATPWPLLIIGETGTGKTSLASAIHETSRRSGRFVVLNCAALAPALVESQLFGYAAGAFTGAAQDTPGLFEAANGGTLLLDEIGDLAADAQARLLRVLESRTVRRIGEPAERPIDVRVIGATHQPLPEQIAAGTFREDLYYRVGSFVLEVPPLRERSGDIRELVEHFLFAEAGDGAPTCSRAALPMLARHHWPGNLRELQSVLRQALVATGSGDEITPAHLPGIFRAAAQASTGTEASTDLLLRDRLADAIRGSAMRPDRWAAFLLAFAAETDRHTVVRGDVLPLLGEIRGPGRTTNSIALEWHRKFRPALLGTGLVAAGNRRLRIDLDACREALANRTDNVPAEATAPATPNAEAALPTNLPARRFELVGRDRDLDVLAGMVNDTKGRLVTLTGPGGIGKTSLAVALGHRLLDSYPCGVWFVDLQRARNAADVAAAVASALGLSVSGSGDPVLAAGDALAAFAEPLLLILDNVEHVVGHAPATVSEWLHRAAQLRILATSRQTLALQGERRYELGPLAVPPVDATPQAISEYDGVRLLIQHGTRIGASLPLTAGNARALATICAGLSGIPLALELAATRLRTLSPRQLADRLFRKFDLLRAGASTDRPDHHRTLEHALEWSVSTLEPDERQTFADLCVFTGGFTLDAADAVLSPGDSNATLDQLESLVEKSLIHVDLAAAPEPRYDCYLVIRDYGRQLDGAKRAGVARRHAHWYARMASRHWHAARTAGASSVSSMALLVAEQGNLASAREWAIANGEPEQAATLTLGMATAAFGCGSAHNALRWLADTLDALPASSLELRVDCTHLRAAISAPNDRTGWPDRAADLQRTVRDAHDQAASAGDETRSQWLRRLSTALRLQIRELDDEHDARGLELARQSIEAADASGDIGARSEARAVLGRLLLRIGQGREASAMLNEASELAARSGPSRMLARTLTFAAAAALFAADVNRSIRLDERAHALFDAMGDRVSAAVTLLGRATTEITTGRIDDGRKTLHRVESADRSLVGGRIPSAMLRIRVLLAHREGDEEQVQTLTTDARLDAVHADLYARRTFGLRRADALRRLGRLDEALAAFDAIDAARMFPRACFLHAMYRACTLHALGRIDDAGEAARHARALFTSELVALGQAGDADLSEATSLLTRLPGPDEPVRSKPL